MERLNIERANEANREGFLPLMSVTKEDIEKIVEDEEFQAGEILQVFKKDLAYLYDAEAGTIEGYRLGEHTKMVLKQFIKYFNNKPLPEVSKSFFLTFLALHDIGKPFAVEEASIDKQYEYTSIMLNHILKEMGYSEREIGIAQSLVDGDPIRMYLYKREDNTQEIAESIVHKAEAAHMDIVDFWELLFIFWKSDAGSYTKDAGGKASLDRMFEFEPDEGEMHLAPHIEERIGLLKKAVFSYEKEKKGT